jgi:peptidoglycan hydrolase-like protein with peptidoglycan-binding domain
MHPSVQAFFRDFSKTFEGLVQYMYLDVKNLATIGIGNLLENPNSHQLTSEALNLPFQFKNSGAAASVQDIQNDFASIKAHPGVSAGGYDQYTKLQLDLPTIDQLVQNKLAGNETGLKGISEFSDLDNWPADAQLGLFSMAYAIGPAFAAGGKWPSFRAGCAAKDFVKAANECRMTEQGNPGVVPRNRADELLFLYAARVLANNLPIANLIYPNVLKSDGTLLDMGLPADQGGYPVLKQGSSGQAVQVLQTLLGMGVTGTFDAGTKQAVQTFQQGQTDPDGNPLTPDGIVGWNTWRALVRNS